MKTLKFIGVAILVMLLILVSVFCLIGVLCYYGRLMALPWAAGMGVSFMAALFLSINLGEK